MSGIRTHTFLGCKRKRTKNLPRDPNAFSFLAMAFLNVEADDDDGGVMLEGNVGGREFGVGVNEDV